MFSKTLRYGKGYAGMWGHKCWIAAITGTDKQYGLQRAFIEPESVEREHFNRARTMIDFEWELDVGLYEASEAGERWFFFVQRKKDGEYIGFRPTEARVKAMAELMDHGMPAEDARKATMPQPTEQPKGQ